MGLHPAECRAPGFLDDENSDETVNKRSKPAPEAMKVDVRYFRKKRLGWLGTSEGLEPHADREDAVWLKCSFCRRGHT